MHGNTASAMLCVDKLQRGGSVLSFIWWLILRAEIAAGVSYQEAGVTKETMLEWENTIGIPHGKQLLLGIRNQKKPCRETNERIACLHDWLTKCGFTYEQIGATPEEIARFALVRTHPHTHP